MNILEQTIEDFYANCDEDNQSEYATPRILHSLVLAQRPAVVVEIGCHMGFSSMALASGLKFNAETEPSAYLQKWKREYHDFQAVNKVKGKLYCIDPKRQPHFNRRMEKFGLAEYIEFFEMPAGKVDRSKIPEIDFLFIDGNHDYDAVLEDFKNYFPKVKPGGYIAMHDYFPNSPTPAMPWWGPNVLGKQLKEVYGFTDNLIIDTSFSGLAIYRKKVDHIDYDFYSKSLAKSFLQFYIRKYRNKFHKIVNKAKNFANN